VPRYPVGRVQIRQFQTDGFLPGPSPQRLSTGTPSSHRTSAVRGEDSIH